ncbi:MAG: NfeD family protein [Nocardioidaceae bacterium]|nr:NfeD family protein [Nocardioidaceae bacterium]MCL2612158.1 NfeD family protein [Nocardioidaceae bacterium]
MHWMSDHHWEVWLGISILLLVGEMCTLDLIMGMLAVGGLAGMLTAMLSGSWVVQGVVAAVVALAMLAVVRPSLARTLHSGPEIATGNARVIGMRGKVVEPVGPMQTGRIAIDGEFWTASADAELPIGLTVEVVEIRGATAHVRPAEASEFEQYHPPKEI